MSHALADEDDDGRGWSSESAPLAHTSPVMASSGDIRSLKLEKLSQGSIGSAYEGSKKDVMLICGKRVGLVFGR